jgi:hypothetical protein
MSKIVKLDIADHVLSSVDFIDQLSFYTITELKFRLEDNLEVLKKDVKSNKELIEKMEQALALVRTTYLNHPKRGKYTDIRTFYGMDEEGEE